jgi:hypothetical protein
VILESDNVLYIAHAGCNNGHIGYHAGLNLLQQRFNWIRMAKDMQKLCTSCLYCVTTRKGLKIPRPLSEACHGIKGNQVLHFDYMYI